MEYNGSSSTWSEEAPRLQQDAPSRRRSTQEVPDAMSTTLPPYCAIPLTRGFVALVDEDLYPALEQRRWYANANGYAARHDGRSRSDHRLVYMHREVLRLRGVEIPDRMEVDHLNWNKLDNRSDNLRVVTRSTNGRNKPLPPDNTSGFRGVSLHKPSGRWVAYVRVEGKTKYLGLHTTPEEAATAYEQACIRYGLPLANDPPPPVPLPATPLSASRPLHSNNTSGYRGVVWDKESGKWIAQIKVKGRHFNLGRFPTPEAASDAHERAWREKGRL